jgi:hypothetical protein
MLGTATDIRSTHARRVLLRGQVRHLSEKRRWMSKGRTDRLEAVRYFGRVLARSMREDFMELFMDIHKRVLHGHGQGEKLKKTY